MILKMFIAMDPPTTMTSEGHHVVARNLREFEALIRERTIEARGLPENEPFDWVS